MKAKIPFRSVLLYVYFPIVMLNFYLVMHGINTYRFLLLPCILLLIVFSLPILVSNLGKGRNVLFSLFLLYNVLSIISYAYNGRPIVCYTTALRYTIFPMIFYLYAQDERDDSNKLYHYLLYSCIFCFVIGLYLYWVGPDYYKAFIMHAKESAWYSSTIYYSEDDVLNYARMSSFFGSSYAVCYFSVPCLIISLMFALNKQELIKPIVLYLFAVICLISSLLCMQRLSMATGMLFVFFYLYYSRKRIGMMRILLFVVLIVGIVMIVLSYSTTERGSVIFDLISRRVDQMSLSGAMSERSGLSQIVLGEWNYYLLGGGIGSYSTVARQYGSIGVSDAEYVRILTENGFLGTIIFALLIISHIAYGVKNFRIFGIEVCIIIFYLIACIGSNALSISFIYSPVFWYALGHIQNNAYKNRFIQEQLSV